MDRRIVAFFGHHKCATTWFNRILRATAWRIGWKWVNFDNPSMFGLDLEAYLSTHPKDVFSYTNASFKFVKPILDKIIGIHLIRDPRDILVSAYFSHLYSHPTRGWTDLIRHRKRLQSMEKEEGLFEEMNFRIGQFKDMTEWDYNNRNVLEIKMEELTSNPEEGIIRIFDHCGIIGSQTVSISNRLANYINQPHLKSRGRFPLRYKRDSISTEELKKIIYMNRFERLAKGRAQGEEDVKSHYRRGTQGDWKNHFTPELKKAFKDRYGNLVIHLGYEKSNDW